MIFSDWLCQHKMNICIFSSLMSIFENCFVPEKRTNLRIYTSFVPESHFRIFASSFKSRRKCVYIRHSSLNDRSGILQMTYIYVISTERVNIYWNYVHCIITQKTLRKAQQFSRYSNLKNQAIWLAKGSQKKVMRQFWENCITDRWIHAL